MFEIGPHISFLIHKNLFVIGYNLLRALKCCSFMMQEYLSSLQLGLTQSPTFKVLELHL